MVLFRSTRPASRPGGRGAIVLAVVLGAASCARAAWQYPNLDTTPPSLVAITPVPGSTVARLTEVTITFSEQVLDVEEADLLMNGEPATNVLGSGAGPYTFQFAGPAPGTVQLSWAPNHGIRDTSPLENEFRGTNWSYTLHIGEFSGNVIISEFLAANTAPNGLRDEDGDPEDWIEIHNRGATDVNLGGWSLSDDPAEPGLWIFPEVTLRAGQYLIVFASGKDRKPTDGRPLHTNFKLSSSGEHLALYNAEFPRQVTTQFQPAYPPQRPEIAYGLFNGLFRYSTNPTPGRANSGAAQFSGFAAEPTASVKSGFFDQPFNLTLHSVTPDATIRYTLDGTEPTPSRGLLYTGPIPVAGGPDRGVVNVRAIALRSDLLCSRVSTYSYIFPEFVLRQPTNPPGCPPMWTSASSSISVSADYEMDPKVVTNAAYTARLREAFTNLPTLSLVLSDGDLFSPARGLYANPNPPASERAAWERAASAEFILPDGTRGFRLEAGLRVQGGTSRDPARTRKHSFRLIFNSDYDGRLNYRFFDDSPVQSYQTLVLDAGANLTWHNRSDNLAHRAQYVRDQFVSDAQLAMGHPAAHGRFVHLYLNGLYWGLYDVHERPDEDFAASYLGGDAAQYDVVRNSDGYLEVVNGDLTAWNAMMALVNNGLTNAQQFAQLCQFLDLDSFIDYMILNFYAGNVDWAMHNWYAIRKRAPGAGFRFVSWDAEMTLKDVNENNTAYNQANSPTMIHSHLKYNSEYKLRFADRVHRHFFNGGVFSVDPAGSVPDLANPLGNVPGALYLKRIAEIDRAITLESARWGDAKPGRETWPFTRDAEWLTELRWLRDTYFPQRSAVVLNQFRSLFLYPGMSGVPAPAFSQHGGPVPFGFALTLSAPLGTIYYTTNGSDPRAPLTGAVAPEALIWTGAPILITSNTVVKARARNGTLWSPIVEATFTVAQVGSPIRITEIMYKPAGGDAFEFIELQNVDGTPVDLSGWSFEGVTCVLPVGTILPPGGLLVVASGKNPAGFLARYPGVTVAAWFRDKLSNDGERLALEDARGRTVISVNYSSLPPWPNASTGAALEIIDPLGDPDDPANWRASANYGTPGALPAPPASSPVRFNEIMAPVGLTDGSVAVPGWIELVNRSSTDLDLANWCLTDDANPRKFVFPAGTLLPAGGLLVVICDTDTAFPGLHTGFTLAAQGGTLFLFNAQSNRADSVSFGLQVSGFSVGQLGSGWDLTFPTPGLPNVRAPTAPASNLVINEWLANPPPAAPDWFELFNRASLPVPLQGLHFETANAAFQITALSFVPPRGFVRLFADENPGPDHVDFKLPAAGGYLLLHDRSAAVVDRIDYGPQLEGISEGRLPDGAPTVMGFPGSPTPGAPNSVVSQAGPRLNEVMARNQRAVVGPGGNHPDWIELFNPTAQPFDLTGMSVSLGKSQPGQWRFPPGTVLDPGGYLVLWCDDTGLSGLHTALQMDRALDGDSDSIFLFNPAGQVVDYIEYGPQIADLSIGRAEAGWWLLAQPTPGAPNADPAPLGPPTALRFNEWMAEMLDGADWFELFNLDPRPVDLGGLHLTDDPSLQAKTRFTIAPLSFLAGRGWLKFVADDQPNQGRHHVNFKLDAAGESLRLYDRDLTLLDGLDMGPQAPRVSEGRLPDGADRLVTFPDSPTPGGANYLPLDPVAINEVLAHGVAPFEDAIELFNPGDTPLDLTGWWLSDDPRQPRKFRIPAGTVLPPGGFVVFYQHQFGAPSDSDPGFTLDGLHEGQVLLSEADAAGTLTGRRVAVTFGPAEPNVSFGRFPTSAGCQFAALAEPTFGVDEPTDVTEFRRGTGAPNAPARVGPIVINEIMYQPLTSSGTGSAENPQEEYLELFNASDDPVPLADPAAPHNVWRLGGGIAFNFPTGACLPPRGYLLLVNFDPVADPITLAAFTAKYRVPPGTPVFGPFAGRLRNEGESLVLYKPGAAQTGGCVPAIPIERAAYAPLPPWPTAPAGGGASLQRLDAEAYGNDPLNWKGEPPTPGRANRQDGDTPPVITAQPSNQVLRAGSDILLAVGASGSEPLTFQWLRDGVEIPEATNALLSIPEAQPIHSGLYKVRVSNPAGTLFSQPALVAVFVPPAIRQPPRSVWAAIGARVSFQVEVEGTPPLSIQWFFNGQPIPGATNQTLTLDPVTTDQAGTYEAVVANGGGSTTSDPATLTVTGADTDGDNLPDAWEIAHGLNPNDPTDAARDHDNDGLTDLQEFRAGTDPRDPASCLKLAIANADGGPGERRLRFTAVAGISYTIEFRDGLTAPWQKLLDVPAGPTTRLVELPNSGTNTPLRFYRLVTPMQP